MGVAPDDECGRRRKGRNNDFGLAHEVWEEELSSNCLSFAASRGFGMGGRAIFVWYDGESCVKDDTESDADAVGVVADESAPLDALEDDLEVESDSVSISLESESMAREDMLGIASRSASMGGQDMVTPSDMENSSPSSTKLLRGSGRGAKRIFRCGVGGVLALALVLLFGCLDDDDAPEDEEDATEFEEDVVGNGYNDEE